MPWSTLTRDGIPTVQHMQILCYEHTNLLVSYQQHNIKNLQEWIKWSRLYKKKQLLFAIHYNQKVIVKLAHINT